MILFVVLLFLVSASCEGCGDALTELVNRVSYIVPDVALGGSGDAVLVGTTCGHVTVGGMRFSDSPEIVMLELDASNVTTVCQSTLQDTQANVSSPVTISLSAPLFRIQLSYAKTQSGLLESIYLKLCDVSFTATTALDKNLSPFALAVSDAVCIRRDAFRWISWANHALEDLNSAMQPYLGINYTTRPAPAVGPGHFNITDHAIYFEKASKVLGAVAKNDDLLVNNLIRFSQQFFPEAFSADGNVLLRDAMDLSSHLKHNGPLILSNIQLQGIDSFSSFKVLQPVLHARKDKAYSFSFDVALRDLTLLADANITASLPDHFPLNGTHHVNASVHGLRMHMEMQVAVDTAVFDRIECGSLTTNGVACLMTALDNVELTLLNISVLDASFPSIGGNVTSPLLDRFSELLDALYDGALQDAVHGALQAKTRRIMDHWAHVVIPKAKENPMQSCPPWNPAFNLTNTYVDFMQNPTIFFMQVGTALLQPGSSPISFSINWIIYYLCDKTNEARFDTALAHLDVPLSPALGISTLSIDLSDLRVHNPDSFYDISLLVPTAPDQLDSHVYLGGPGEGNALKISTVVDLNVNGSSVAHGKGARNLFTLEFLIYDLQIDANIIANLNYSTIGKLTLQELADVSHLCFLSPFDMLHARNLSLYASKIGLNIDCEQCDSSQLEVWSTQLQSGDFNTALTNDLNALSSVLSNQEIIDMLNDFLDHLVDVADVYCHTHHAPPLPGIRHHNHKSKVLLVALIAGLIVGTLLLGFFLYRHFFRKRWAKKRILEEYGHVSQRLMSVYDDNSVHRGSVADDEEIDTKVLQDILQDSSVSRHPLTPFSISVLVSFVLVAINGLFLCAHIMVGASIYVSIDLMGTDIFLRHVFDFSLVQSLQDMWNAGIYPLAVLIVVFSGIWPYVKTGTLMFCWWARPSVLPIEKRDRLLHWLDVLGKWSLIDVCVLVILMTCFSFSVANHGSGYLPSNLVKADIVVLPSIAIVCFLCGAILQLVATHALIYFHRRQTRIGKGNSYRSALSHHAFCAQDGSKVGITRFGRCLGYCAVFAAAAMIATAGNIDLVRFNIQGFVSGFTHQASRTFSIVSTAVEILRAPFGVGPFSIFVFAVFILFVYVLPILHMFCLAVLWNIPMTIKKHRQWLFSAECLFAWSAMDVYVLSVIVAIYEIKQFVSFMIGDKCDLINLGLSIIKPAAAAGNYTCFDVQAKIIYRSYFQFIALGLHWIVGYVVTRISDLALREQETAASLTTRIPPEPAFDTTSRTFKLMQAIGLVYKIETWDMDPISESCVQTPFL